ncbi:MAG: hypothetical protein M3070_03765 [Actinomycetota bacterium]|nr:hypothetical protein [Actinomycetota bacterium]
MSEDPVAQRHEPQSVLPAPTMHNPSPRFTPTAAAGHYRNAYSDAFLDGDVAADRLTVWTDRLREPDSPLHNLRRAGDPGRLRQRLL